MLIASISWCRHSAFLSQGSLSSSIIEHRIQSASTVSSFIVALTLYPEVQRRAQAQIDSVISRDRLPTFEDRSRLPYIEAICKELLRWQIVTPLCTSSSPVAWINLSQHFFPKLFPMRQPRTTFTEGSLSQKVRRVTGWIYSIISADGILDRFNYDHQHMVCP